MIEDRRGIVKAFIAGACVLASCVAHKPPEQTAETGPPPAASPAGRAPVLKQAMAAIEGHDWGRARSLLESVPRSDPEYPTALYNLGILYQETGEIEASRDAFNTLTTVTPSNADAWLNLGWADYLLGDPARAEEATLRARELAPAYAAVHYNLGLYRMALGRLQASISSYQHALTLDTHRDGLVGALKDLEEYRSAHPSEIGPYYALTAFYRAIGDVPEEIDALEHLLAGGEEPAGARDRLNLLREHGGQAGESP